MCLRKLALFVLLLPIGARRSIRIDDFHQKTQQQHNTFTKGLEVSAEAREAFIPGRFGTGTFNRVGPQAGALREGSKQVGRTVGHVESHRAAPWFRLGPDRAKVTLQAGSGAPDDSARAWSGRSSTEEIQENHPDPIENDEGAGALVGTSDADMAHLRARIQKIEENGIPTPSQKLFEIATENSPTALMLDFGVSSSLEVKKAMQEAVTSLLGVLPIGASGMMNTTGDKLAALMFRLQMTGYMLRNAEYVMAIRRVLDLKTRSLSEYRDAFDRIDIDGSGYIEGGEVELLLSELYHDDVPPFEVSSFVRLFDTDGDQRISWDEFVSALGGMVDSVKTVDDTGSNGRTNGDESASSKPDVSGTLKLTLDDGSDVEIDAAAYMEQLAAEARTLRAELAKTAAEQTDQPSAATSSISAYINSLPVDQQKILSSGISGDVVKAMRDIVQYILRTPSRKYRERTVGKDERVTMEKGYLQDLSLYQLILGYRLREAEAKGVAKVAIGQ